MSVYVIAELGINHQGNLDTAFKLIEAAKEAGADAVKFQKRTIDAVYTPDELAAPRDSIFGSTNGHLKYGLEFDATDYGEIDRYCRDREMSWSASCWDRLSVDVIASFSPPWLKIPSALLTNHALVLAYKATGIPLILSTGMSTWEEIDDAVWTLEGIPLTLLHCHSSYPSPLDEINLACIKSFKERYPGVQVGYSSHTVSPWPCLMAAVYGAEVIEFHLTIDRSLWGSDQSSSLEPHAAKKLIQEIRTWEICEGDGIKKVHASEEAVKAKLRR